MELIPKQLGNFQIRENVGRSDVFLIYRAFDTQAEQEILLTFLDPRTQYEPEFLRRFVELGQSATKLQHPNLVRVREAGSIGQYYYLSSEPVIGTTLATLLRQRNAPMSPDETADIINQVAAGLDYAHDLGFVHQNLSPSEIWLAKDGTALVAGFGLARRSVTGTVATLDHEAETMVVGPIFITPFIAPEQARGEEEISRRSDVYSLGAIAYTMLVGQPPFAETDQLLLLNEIIYGTPLAPESLNPNVPAGMAFVIKFVLSKEANLRYGKAGEFAVALNQGKMWRGSAIPTTAGLAGAPASDVIPSGDRGFRGGLRAIFGLGAVAILIGAVLFGVIYRPSLFPPSPEPTTGDVTAIPTLAIVLPTPTTNTSTPLPDAITALIKRSDVETPGAASTPTEVLGVDAQTTTPEATAVSVTAPISPTGSLTVALSAPVVVSVTQSSSTTVALSPTNTLTTSINSANAVTSTSEIALAPTATQAEVPTATATATLLATATPAVAPTATPTQLATLIPTALPTATATATDLPTALPTATATTLPTATATTVAVNAAAAPTQKIILVPTDTPAPTMTNTPLPTATASATNTAAPTDTPLPTATATASATNTAAPTNTPLPTATATPLATNTPLPTNTSLPTATATASETVAATLAAVPTLAPTATLVPPTLIPTATATAATLSTATATSTAPATNTRRPTSTNTRRPTATPTPIATYTPIPTHTATATETPTNVPATPIPLTVSRVTLVQNGAAWVARVSGEVEPGSTVQGLVDNQAAGSTKARANGAWTLNVPLAGPGQYAVSVLATLPNGEAVTANTPPATVVVPTPAPPPPPSGSAQLLEPGDGDGGGGERIFRWKVDFTPAAGQAFELIFWKPGQDPMANGFGLASPTLNNNITVNLNVLDDQLGPLLDSGNYEWGVLLVQTSPYKRLRFLDATHKFAYSRDGGGGSKGSTGGGQSSGE